MKYNFGWRRDLPDFRDHTHDHPGVQAIIGDAPAVLGSAPGNGISRIDLREWCSPVEDQKSLGSCTANASAGLLEYFERKALGNHVDASRLFIYKATRDLMKARGDTGAELRNAMQALAMFGAPPEEFWPYDVSKFDTEPPAFVYAMAKDYQSTQYYRLDPAGTTPATALANVKTKLLAGLPSMFGFTCYSSIDHVGADGGIPFPAASEKTVGGHAIVAVGFDEAKQIGASTGALLIRNSWGASWGDHGYGWLPFQYVLRGLATDFWSLVRAEYVDTNLFG